MIFSVKPHSSTSLYTIEHETLYANKLMVVNLKPFLKPNRTMSKVLVLHITELSCKTAAKKSKFLTPGSSQSLVNATDLCVRPQGKLSG